MQSFRINCQLYRPEQSIRPYWQVRHIRKSELGFIRYASTNRKYQAIDDVPIFIYPADLLSQKSASWNDTNRKIKYYKNYCKVSIRTKVSKKSEDKSLRIGQIVLIQWEYANENAQDVDGKNNPSALKIFGKYSDVTKSNEVITYV